MPRKKKLIKRSVVVGHKPTGEPVIKWYSGYTEKELQAKKQAVKQQYVTGALTAQTDVPFSFYVQEWYDTYKKGKLSASSKQNYNCAINKHILPYIGDKQLRAISAMDLQQILNRLSGHGTTTIGDVKSVLKNAFAKAYAQGLIDRDPAAGLELPKARRESRRDLTDAETAATLAVGRRHEYGLLLLLLYYTGMRRGEALGLQWGDIDWRKRKIRVRRDVDFATGQLGNVKTPASLREIPMPQPLYEVLHPLRSMPHMHVITPPRGGAFLSRATYERWWHKLMIELLKEKPEIEKCIVDKKAETYGSILTAHYYRHNYASILYAANVDVLSAQRILGHSDPKTTIAIYAHLRKEREALDVQRICDAFEVANTRT